MLSLTSHSSNVHNHTWLQATVMDSAEDTSILQKIHEAELLWSLDQLLNKGLTLFLEEILDFTHKHFYGPKCQQQVRDFHPGDNAYWEPNFQNGMFTR